MDCRPARPKADAPGSDPLCPHRLANGPGLREAPRGSRKGELMADADNSSSNIQLRHLGDYIEFSISRSGDIVWKRAFDASEMDDLIAMMGRFRGALPEQVNEELDANARVEAVPSPSIVVRHLPEGACEVICRHTRFGWLAFLLDDNARNTLASVLLENNPANNQIT